MPKTDRNIVAMDMAFAKFVVYQGVLTEDATILSCEKWCVCGLVM